MMGKWMNKAINPSIVPESLDHIHIEDLARLAEGAVDAVERRHLIGHLNRCRCRRIIGATGLQQADDFRAAVSGSLH